MSLLLIESSDLTNNQIKFDNPIKDRYELVAFSFTNNIYNVNDRNNQVYITENTTDYTIPLTNGFYNAEDLREHLQTRMNAVASGTYTITLDENTNKFNISSTITFYFTFGTNTSNSARLLLGMNETDQSTSITQSSDNPIDLNDDKCFYININENDDKNIEGITFFNTSFMIQATGNFGEKSTYNNSDNFKQQVKFRNIKTLTFKIHDRNMNTIDLNSEWLMVLKKIGSK